MAGATVNLIIDKINGRDTNSIKETGVIRYIKNRKKIKEIIAYKRGQSMYDMI